MWGSSLLGGGTIRRDRSPHERPSVIGARSSVDRDSVYDAARVRSFVEQRSPSIDRFDYVFFRSSVRSFLRSLTNGVCVGSKYLLPHSDSAFLSLSLSLSLFRLFLHPLVTQADLDSPVSWPPEKIESLNKHHRLTNITLFFCVALAFLWVVQICLAFAVANETQASYLLAGFFTGFIVVFCLLFAFVGGRV